VLEPSSSACLPNVFEPSDSRENPHRWLRHLETER
jgi:hypothetical protein